MSLEAYQQVEKIFQRINRLDHMLSIAQWDEAVMMPAGGAQARGDASAELTVIKLEILKSAELKGALGEARATSEKLNDWQRANLIEAERIVHQANAVDTDLMEAIAKQRVISERAWRGLRAENNWLDFLPLFKESVRLARQEGEQRSAGSSLSPYEALMQTYEPGLEQRVVEECFLPLRQSLPELIGQVEERQKSITYRSLGRPVSVDLQRSMVSQFMKWLGFNFDHGRLDESHHPFCGGVAEDVRLTTRYDAEGFFSGFMGVLHETGHSLYEQNRPAEWIEQPVSHARGMVMHESQSLFVEMQVGRSREFYDFAGPLLKSALAEPGDPGDFWTPDHLYQMGRHMKRGYIRVDADELTYPLHIILRFEIEQGLIRGDVSPEEVPSLWNEKMKAYLGLSTQGRDDLGCMQDVHWPAGLFGYFPCYTLGALTAAQLFQALEKEHPHIRLDLSQGNFKPIFNWLKEKVWSMGSKLSREDLMIQVTRDRLSPDAFLRHVEQRYLA